MEIITINKNILGGIPCFAGTRVPARSLFQHLKEGYTLAEFLADFPSVDKSQAEAALELAEGDVPLHAVRVGEA